LYQLRENDANFVKFDVLQKTVELLSYVAH